MCACLNIGSRMWVTLKPRSSDLFYTLMETDDVWGFPTIFFNSQILWHEFMVVQTSAY